jgi:hypothetical protein
MFDSLIKAIQQSAQAQFFPISSERVLSDKPLMFLPQRISDMLETKSLESVATYCADLSQVDKENVVGILVENYETVRVLGLLNPVTLLTASAQLPSFIFGNYYDREEFQIAIASRFVQCENLGKIISLVGKLTDLTLKTVEDDGISQTVSVKAGISMSGEVTVPPRVRLAPYRTFLEVEQPTSEFLFRIKKDRDGNVRCALFEADGGAWKAEARSNIVAWLQNKLGNTAPTILF